MDTWGSLPKTQDSNTTIDQEIDAKITAHLADADAHLDVGGSLQSHRASEIMDHLAESVLNDKIQPEARAYVAIVAQDGSGDFDDIQEAVSYAADKGGGRIYIKKGRYLQTDNIVLGALTDLEGDGQGETIIDFQNQAHGIIGHPQNELCNGSVVFFKYTNGSDIIEVDTIENPYTYHPAVGSFIEEREWTGSFFEVTEIIDSTHLRIDTVWPNPTDVHESAQYYLKAVTNGQTHFVLPESWNLANFGIKDYYRVQFFVNIDGNEYTYDYGISNLGTNTLDIDAPFAGVNETYQMSIYEPARNPNILQHFDVVNSTATYAINANGKIPVIFSYLNFDHVSNIFYYYPPWSIPTPNYLIEEINFSNVTGSSVFAARGYSYSRVIGNYAVNGGVMFPVNDGSSVSNCKIDMGSQSANYVFGSGPYSMVVQNNIFTGVSQLVNTSYVQTKWVINGNYISIAASKNMRLKMTYSSICGNVFVRGSGASVSFAAGDNYNVFVGNANAGTVGNAGTGNVIANNT